MRLPFRLPVFQLFIIHTEFDTPGRCGLLERGALIRRGHRSIVDRWFRGLCAEGWRGGRVSAHAPTPRTPLPTLTKNTALDL